LCMRKYASRAIVDLSEPTVIRIHPMINMTEFEHDKLFTKIKFSEISSHGKLVDILYLDKDNRECWMSLKFERFVHPMVKKLAELMQKKLNERRTKYSNQVYDTWKELDRVALLKHFEEECLEFKSELYKFISNPDIIPNQEEMTAMYDELADVANMGSMLIERILFGKQVLIPTNETKVCKICGKEIKAELMCGDICYTCKKLEVHKK